MQTYERRLTHTWIPLVTLVLGVGSFTALVVADALEPMQQAYIGMGIMLATPLLLIIWLLFLSGLSWVQRFVFLFLGVAATGGLVFGLTKVLRWKGSTSGSGIPRVFTIWNEPEEAKLDALKVEDGGRIDLVVHSRRDYPQFLGRDRDGVAHGVRLGRDWKSHPPKELWRKQIGLGWSAFAIVGDYAITQEQREDKELVVCYEVKTGKVRWKHEHDTRLHDKQGGDGPRATPTIVDGRVYTLGGTGVLDCIDGVTGKNLWSHETLADSGTEGLIWGASSSPLVVDDKVIVMAGRTLDSSKKKGPSLLAYDRDKGKLLWKAGNDDASYASAALATFGGSKQVLSVNAHSVSGHDPRDGKELWSYPWPGEMAKASQPVPLDGDRVFVSAGYDVGCVLLQLKRDASGQWSASEQWATRKMRTQFSNVVMFQGCAFGLDSRILACVDLQTGEQKSKGGRYDFGQVMRVDDLLVVQAEKGFVALVEANPSQLRELGRLPALSSKTWNNPALSGPYLLVRNDQEAVCYELPIEE